MSLSATISDSFTRTHARYLSSKVVSDLYQCSRLYGSPAAHSISDYETELIEMLVGDYLSEYEFGFKENDRRIVCWRYQVSPGGDLVGGDQCAGGLYARAKVANASYYNFLSYSYAWWQLTHSARERIEGKLPFARSSGYLPTDGEGYWTNDRSYSKGGVSLSRRTFTPA